MRPTPTKTLIARLKREAKARVKRESISHSAALEQAAESVGYASWHALLHEPHASAEKAPIAPLPALPIDPVLPRHFDDTPNEQRSKKELALWWDRPFAQTRPDGTLLVRCLDGGAWDRSTNYGIAASATEALELAGRKLSEWKRSRERPIPYVRADGRLDLIREPQRPDLDHTVLLENVTAEDIADWIKANT